LIEPVHGRQWKVQSYRPRPLAPATKRLRTSSTIKGTYNYIHNVCMCVVCVLIKAIIPYNETPEHKTKKKWKKGLHPRKLIIPYVVHVSYYQLNKRSAQGDTEALNVLSCYLYWNPNRNEISFWYTQHNERCFKPHDL
jgi:hypothetical protein